MQLEADTAQKLLDIVRDFVCGLRTDRSADVRVSLDSAFEAELGLDSLSRAELISRVERAWDVTFVEQVFAAAETPRDLLRAIAQADGRLRSESTEAVAEADPHAGNASIPERAETFQEVLQWHVKAHPDRPHILLYGQDDTSKQFTYGDLQSGAQKVAAGLAEQGLLPGQTAAVMLPTSIEYFYCFMGILLAGGIPVPLYPPARLTQIVDHLRRHFDILNNAQVQILITIPEAMPIARLLRSQVPELKKVVEAAVLCSTTAAGIPQIYKPEDIAFLQYTSGSTGTPKGVVLTHSNLLINIRTMARVFGVTPSDTFVSWLPLYHDMGLIGAWLSSMYCAMLLVLMSPLAFLTRPSRWLRAIHRHRGTISAGPNFAFEYCLAKVGDEEMEGVDLSSWRMAINGAEQVSPATIARFQQRFGPYGFRPEAMIPSYGLAEASLGLAFPAGHSAPKTDRIDRNLFMRTLKAVPADEKEDNPLFFVSCGHPLPGHEVRIVDVAGGEAPERQEGRVLFKGPSCTSGYYRNPAGTAALFEGEWLDSGDLGYIAEGELYITGRSKDIIIRAGRNIYPSELEEAVGRLEGLRKGCVAVFGTKDQRSGTEQLVVLAETKERDPAALESLRRAVNKILIDLLGAPPDDVVLAPPHKVLKTSSGKIRRAASRELYESGRIHKKQRAVWWQLTRLSLRGAVPQLRRIWKGAGVFFYAGYLYLVLLMMAPLVWTAVVAAPGFEKAYGIMRYFAKIFLRLGRIPITVEGAEHLDPESHFIVVSNHCSFADGPILAAALPINTSYVAKVELSRNVLSRLFFTRLRTAFVERFDSRKGTSDARQVIRAAQGGQSFIFFPEGTFYRMPGLQPFRMGAFLTAARAGAPVVPVAIRGSRSLLRGDTWFPRRTAISVRVCPPILPDGSDWEAAVKLRDAARSQILQYCGEPDLAE